MASSSPHTFDKDPGEYIKPEDYIHPGPPDPLIAAYYEAKRSHYPLLRQAFASRNEGQEEKDTKPPLQPISPLEIEATIKQEGRRSEWETMMDSLGEQMDMSSMRKELDAILEKGKIEDEKWKAQAAKQETKKSGSGGAKKK